MRIPMLVRLSLVEEPWPRLRPAFTVDGLGATRTEGLARLRQAIERRAMEGESVGQAFEPDGTGKSGG